MGLLRVVEDSFREAKAVIFDLDETLIDAPKGLSAAHRAIIENLFDYLNLDKKRFSIDNLNKKLVDFDDRMNREREYDRDIWWPEFVEELGIDTKLSPSQIEGLTKIYWKTYAENAVPYSDSNQVLDYLKKEGYLLGMITDTDGPGVSKWDRIFDLDFSSLFDAIVVGGDDTERSKPDPRPFELICDKLSLKAEECVMIGDKPFTDIKGANSVGMKTILVRRREWDSDGEPDLTIDSLTELKKIL